MRGTSVERWGGRRAHDLQTNERHTIMGKSTLQTGATNSSGQQLRPTSAIPGVPGEPDRRWMNVGTDADTDLAGLIADCPPLSGSVRETRRDETRVRLEALYGGEANLGRAIDACENVAANLNEIRGANVHNPGIRRLAALGKALAAGELTTEDGFVFLGDIQDEIVSTITELQDEWSEAGEAQALDSALSTIIYQAEARCLDLNF